jgi:hypothetical protein
MEKALLFLPIRLPTKFVEMLKGRIELGVHP